MKLKVLSIFVFFLVLLNIVFLRDYIINATGTFLYNKGLYEESKAQFEKINSLEGVYNKANSEYKLESYSGALSTYESINCEDESRCFFIKNNLGNTYYRLSEQAKSVENQKEFLELSALNYKEALKINYDERIEKNLEYVLNLIDKLKDEENKNDEEQNSENSKSDDLDKQGESSESKTKEDGTQEENSMGENSTSNKNEGKSGLTPEQEQAIEQYEKSLEQAQKYVGEHYNKVYEEQNSINNEFEAFFGNNPFFDNSILDQNTNKKDW